MPHSQHFPVLLNEAVHGLNIQADGIYIDGTFGRGGHSQAILKALSSQGRLIVIDKDLQAIETAQMQFKNDPRVEMIQASFGELSTLCEIRQLLGKVNGVLLDLGVSSPQIDDPQRGFSFQNEGPLDMRMSQSSGITATTWIQTQTKEAMTQVFKEYGEERFAKRIANAIVKARETSPITTTLQLSQIVTDANPAWERHKHPATRVFQAIRIAINQELDDLKQGLEASVDILANQGRLVVISFHSLEDRIVKQFMRKKAKGKVYPKGVPIMQNDNKAEFKKLPKAIKPSSAELALNSRSRSAILRVAERQYQ